MTALATKQKAQFSQELYFELIDQVDKIYNLTDKEKQIMLNNAVPNIGAALAYQAECKHPEQIAVLRLGDYISGIRNPELFLANENLLTRERIELGMHYPGGNPEVIEAGTDLLELISIRDHIHDFEMDQQNGKYNPLTENSLLYKRAELLEEKLRSSEVGQTLCNYANDNNSLWV